MRKPGPVSEKGRPERKQQEESVLLSRPPEPCLEHSSPLVCMC